MKNGYIIMLVITSFLSLIGIVLPYLISHKSNELPLLGFVMIFLVCGFVINYAINFFKKEKEKRK